MSEERYTIEVIGALVLCWINVCRASNDYDETLKGVKGELCVTGKMLVKVVEGSEDSGAEMRRNLEKVFDVDESLRDVFGMYNDDEG